MTHCHHTINTTQIMTTHSFQQPRTSSNLSNLSNLSNYDHDHLLFQPHLLWLFPSNDVSISVHIYIYIVAAVSVLWCFATVLLLLFQLLVATLTSVMTFLISYNKWKPIQPVNIQDNVLEFVPSLSVFPNISIPPSCFNQI